MCWMALPAALLCDAFKDGGGLFWSAARGSSELAVLPTGTWTKPQEVVREVRRMVATARDVAPARG